MNKHRVLSALGLLGLLSAAIYSVSGTMDDHVVSLMEDAFPSEIETPADLVRIQDLHIEEPEEHSFEEPEEVNDEPQPPIPVVEIEPEEEEQIIEQQEPEDLVVEEEEPQPEPEIKEPEPEPEVVVPESVVEPITIEEPTPVVVIKPEPAPQPLPVLAVEIKPKPKLMKKETPEVQEKKPVANPRGDTKHATHYSLPSGRQSLSANKELSFSRETIGWLWSSDLLDVSNVQWWTANAKYLRNHAKDNHVQSPEFRRLYESLKAQPEDEISGKELMDLCFKYYKSDDSVLKLYHERGDVWYYCQKDLI